MVQDLLLFVSSVFLGVFVTYLLSRTDQSERVVLLSLNTLYTSVIELGASVLALVTAPALYVFNVVSSNISWIVRLAILTGLALLVHYNNSLVLESLDNLWRVAMFPLHRFLVAFLEVANLVWQIIVPAYNLAVVLWSQLTRGTLEILAKCEEATVFESVRKSLAILTTFLESFASWGGNIFEDWPVNGTVAKVQDLVLFQEGILKCACDDLTPAVQFVFELIKPAALASLLNHAFNLPLSTIQEVMLATTGLPDFQRPLGHVRGIITSGATYLDDVALGFMRTINVPTATAPAPFVFRTAAEIPLAVLDAVLVPVNVGAKVLMNDAVLKDTDAMCQLSHFDDAFVRLNDVVDQAAVFAEWLPKALGQTSFEVRAPRFAAKALLSVPHLALSVSTDLFWRTVLKKEDPFVTLRQYGGAWGDTSESTGRDPTVERDFFGNLDKAFAAVDAAADFPVTAVVDVFTQMARVFVRYGISVESIVEDRGWLAQGVDCGFAGDCAATNAAAAGACVGRNSPDCVCNPELPLAASTQCQCIFAFPEKAVFNADQPFSNSVLRNFHANPSKMCNSQIVEVVFARVEAVLDMVDKVIDVVEPRCTAWVSEDYLFGSTDFLCSFKIAWRQLVRTVVDVVRQIWSAVMASLTGRSLDADFQIQLQQYERLITAATSTAVAVLPSSFDSHKEAITLAIFHFARLPVVVLEMISYAFQFSRDLIEDRHTDWPSTLRAVLRKCPDCSFTISSDNDVYSFISLEIDLVFAYIINNLSALKNVFRPVSSGFVEFFDDVEAIVNLVQNILGEAVIDEFMFLFKFVTNFVGFMAGKVSIGELTEDFLKLALKTLDLIAQVIGQLIDKLLDALGPVGKFIKGAMAEAKKISDGIKSVGHTITSGWHKFTDWAKHTFQFRRLQLGRDEGDDRTVCDAMATMVCGLRDTHPLISEAVCHEAFCRSFNAVHAIAALGWRGESRCALLVNEYIDEDWSTLRGIERVDLVKCVEMKVIMLRLADTLDMPLPEDLLYDWTRKFSFAKDLVAYFSDHLRGNANAWSHVFERFATSAKLPEDLHLVPSPTQVHALYDQLKQISFEKTYDLSLRLPHRRLLTTTVALGLSGDDVVRRLPAPQLFAGLTLGAYGVDTAIGGGLRCAVFDDFVDVVATETRRTMDIYKNSTAVADYSDYLRNVTKEVVRPAPVTSFELKYEDAADVLRWANTTNGSTVLFGVSVPSPDKIAAFQFQECRFEDIACTSSTMQERMDRFVQSLWICAAIYGLNFVVGYFGVGLNSYLSFLIYAVVVLTHTWSYRWTCFPNVPLCLGSDVLNLMHVLTPGCICSYFPHLAGSCDPKTCLAEFDRTQWKQCELEINGIYDGDVYGIFWPLFFAARVAFADVLRLLNYLPFFYNSEVWFDLMIPVLERREPLPLEWDCFRLNVLNLVLPVAAVAAALSVVPPVLTATYRFTAAVVAVVISAVTVIYAMCVSIEKATRKTVTLTKSEQGFVAKELDAEPSKETAPVDIEISKDLTLLRRRRW